MPLFPAIAAALGLLLLCSFFPGFFFVRRLRWTPLEKLSGSVGFSLILLYLAAWGVYLFGPRDQRPAYWGIAGACALLAAASARDAVRFFRTFRVRHTMAAFGFLLAWTLTMLAMIRVYSGASWAADWAEHFQRALFFLDRLPLSTTFIELYSLPARPPMQNVLGAFFLGLTAGRFEICQIVFSFLNVLLLLPCVLLLPAMGFGKRRALTPLIAIFATSPVVMENVTYTWTKAMTAFYVILAISLYLAGWRKDDRVRTIAAFVALAAGVLTHYSAGPYVLVLGVHYLIRLWRSQPRRGRDALLVAAPAILLLATWFGWSAQTYGWKTTVASNTSVTLAQANSGQNLGKIGANLVDTIVPAWMRGEWVNWPQPNPDGQLRDQAFVFYQVNVIFAMGAFGGPLVLWLLFRRGIFGGKTGREGRLWRALIPACVVLGVAVVGERDTMGVAHLTLLAIEALGLTALAAAFPASGRALRLAIVAGCCIDFGLGVFLQAKVESLENTPTRSVFSEIVYLGNGNFEASPPTGNALFENAQRAWLMKHRIERLGAWLRDLPRGHENDPAFAANWPTVEAELKRGLATDQAWGGWYGRHGGTIEYLGDHVAGDSGGGSDIAAVVFVLLFAGTMALTTRQALETAPAPARIADKKPRRSGARR